MSPPNICRFAEVAPGDAELVGGKGLQLGLLASAGFAVPPGFCLTAAAYRRAASASANGAPTLDDAQRAELLAAYRELAEGLVAVRSSATCEDGADASFAGLQETILGVAGEAPLLDAVTRCWRSLHSQRAVAYRDHQQVGPDVAMAVVVQRLVDAEVSGVLFTRDPLDAEGRRLLIEAAPGLGESVVSGRVMPDRFHLDCTTGDLLDAELHEQAVMLTAAGPVDIAPERRRQPCLDDNQLRELAELARRVEEFYGAPRDVEWAWAGGRLWVLQARPITTASAAEIEQARRDEIAALAARAEPAGTVWARYNLAEVLPDPTPMTWAIVRRFMSGRGGFGLMYRDLGFDPDPRLDDEGCYDLVCGRPYVNLSREPLLYYRDFPYGHSFAKLKADPQAAMYPAPQADPSRKTWRFWRRLPAIVWRMLRSQAELKRQSATHAQRLREQVFPEFAAAVERQRATCDLASLSDAELLDQLEHWTRRTLVDFARESLRPAMFAAVALEELKQSLGRRMAADEAARRAQELVMGVRPDPECDVAGAIQALVAGRLSRDDFLSRCGHRGPHEMELAQPRWRETPATLPAVRADAPQHDHGADTHDADALSATGKIPAAEQHRLRETLDRARTYLALRESSKHYLLRGYALLREILLELDRRYALAGGVFYLTPDELPRLIAGENLRDTIAARRWRRKLALAIYAPPVLFSDDLESLGRPPAVSGAAEWRGTPLSFGVAEGTALVLDEPLAADDLPAGFILVCPSTDPAWTPLFLRARGLVMETGGVLSHGAIVAREIGIPAVAGIADVQRRLRTGQRLRVDGGTGAVHVYE